MFSNEVTKKLKLLTKNTFLIYVLFLLFISIQTIIYCTLIVKINPDLINYSREYQIDRIGFNFNEIITSLINNQTPKTNYVGIDFYISRMPALPYFLVFVSKLITKNFLLIHLLKNIFFGTLIFLTIKFFDKKNSNFLLIICLVSIFYIPHNVVTILSTNFEEGFLIYLIIILFFILNSKFKYKSFYAGLYISIIFFLKASMFYLCAGLSLIIIFTEKKIYRFIPLLFFIVSSIAWGAYSFNKTNRFVFGPSNTSLNGLTTQVVFHKEFNNYYPKYNPDIFSKKVWEDVNKKKFKNEWEVNDYAYSKSIEYIKNNPYDILIGLAKKLYILFLSPFKDTIQDDQFENKIRYSNLPNKFIFIISIILLIKSSINFKKLDNFKLLLNIYFASILALYLFPYLSVYIFPRHCIPVYILSHLYLILSFAKLNKK